MNAIRRGRDRASATADGASRATVAMSSRPDWQPGAGTVELLDVVAAGRRAADEAPSMNRVLVTIAPAIEALTSMYCAGAQRGDGR